MSLKALLIWIFCVGALPVDISCAGQELEANVAIRSTVLADGRYWHALNANDKVLWLRGYLEGVSVEAVREAIKPCAVDASGKSRPAPLMVYDALIPKI